MTTQKQSRDIVLIYATQTQTVLVNVKSENAHIYLAGDVEKWFHTSNYEVDRPHLWPKIVIGLMNDGLGEK